MDLACSILFLYLGNPTFISAGFYAMTGGVVLGWLAILTGALDLIHIYRERPDAMKKALLHGSINSIVVCAYTVFAFIQFKSYPELEGDSIATVIIKSAVVAFMMAGNYLGGSLILKDKILQ